MKILKIKKIEPEQIFSKANLKPISTNNKSNNITKITNTNQEEIDLLELQDTENYYIDEDGNIALKKISPNLEQKKEEFIKKCKEEGIEIRISYTVRSEKEQDELYAIGRTKDRNGNNLTEEEINKIKIIKAMLGKKKNSQETSEILNIDKKLITEVRESLDDNKTYEEISSKLNINKNTIYLIDYLKNGGTTISEISNITNISEENINKIKELIESGKTIDEISNEMNISKDQIIEVKCMLTPDIMASLTNTDKLTVKKILNEINNSINNGEKIDIDNLSKNLNIDPKTISKIYYMEIKDTTKQDIANCFNKNTTEIDNIDNLLKSNKSIQEIAQETNTKENDIKIIKEMLDTSQQSEKVKQIFNITDPNGIKELISTVTNASGSDYSSNHQWGTAFDIVIYDQNGNLIDDNNPNEELEKKVGEIGKSVGLEWGGDWQFVDPPHFELKDAEDIKDKYSNPKEYADTW